MDWVRKTSQKRGVFAKEVRFLELLTSRSKKKHRDRSRMKDRSCWASKLKSIKRGHKMPLCSTPNWLGSRVNGVCWILFLDLSHILLRSYLPGIQALHHMKRAPIAYVSQRDESRPLAIKNWCPETIFPGIATQAGTPPEIQGFELKSGEGRNLTVSADWQGRVWGRTNCSFNSDGTGPASGTFGRACKTGDCYGVVDCKVTVGCILAS